MPLHRAIAVHPVVPVLVILASGLLQGPAAAQEPGQDWEKKEISQVVAEGFLRETASSHVATTGLRRGIPLTREAYDRAHRELWKSNLFADVQVLVRPDPADANKVIVTLRVQEYDVIEKVQFRNVTAIAVNQLKATLELTPGKPLNPFHLKRDRDAIRGAYLEKGYHFSEVREDVQRGEAGTLLTWTVTEGPLVYVNDILFTGNRSVSSSELLKEMKTKVPGGFLFIPGGREPFVEHHLLEDLKRLKLYYHQQGWLDIAHGDAIFIRDLAFDEDKRGVTIRIHVEEGVRYRIRGVRFEFDATSRRIFPEEEMVGWLKSRPGEFYVQKTANDDRERIRERYGERAYISAEVAYNTVFEERGHELDLVFLIRENDKMYVGRLMFEGNTKTREDVIRREFTRTGFLPGEEFNQRHLTRTLQRLRDRQYFDLLEGLQTRTQEGDAPNTRDVTLQVKEGQTGNVRFAAGYSSAYGVLGVIEFVQRNFDVADLPESVGDVVGGTGFAGGGQSLRLRAMPAALRQSYLADFREPYFYGYEFGMGLRGYATDTTRESYSDSRLGGMISVDKRLDPFLAQLSFRAEEIEIDEVEFGAPLAVRQLEGSNTLLVLSPALELDLRDSRLFPTDGVRFAVQYDYAGQMLSGDFDFHRISFEADGHITVLMTETRLKHVASAQLIFGWIHEARGLDDIPLFERFYAGGRDSQGRDSIRGFDFRGMGPHFLGNPIGGEAYVFTSAEYTFPIFSAETPSGLGRQDILRGAIFADLANLTLGIEDLWHVKWRTTIGFGLRIVIPQLGSIPVALDFGWPLSRRDEDERQTITFDIGKLF